MKKKNILILIISIIVVISILLLIILFSCKNNNYNAGNNEEVIYEICEEEFCNQYCKDAKKMKDYELIDKEDIIYQHTYHYSDYHYHLIVKYKKEKK